MPFGSTSTRLPQPKSAARTAFVSVPFAFWPGWVQVVASCLPLAHGRSAIRGVLAGAPLDAIALDVAEGSGLDVLKLAEVLKKAREDRVFTEQVFRRRLTTHQERHALL